MPDNAILSQRDQDFLKDCADFESDGRLDDYALFENYYDGDQNVKLTDRTKKFLEQHGSQVQWCENFCEPIVDILAERLVIDGFGVYAGEQPKRGLLARLRGQDPEDATEAVRSWIDDLLEQNSFDAMQDVAHTTALVKGDAVIVDYVDKDGNPRMTWNPPEVWKFIYSVETPDVIELGIKKWTTKAKGPQNPTGETITRMNLCYPDRIEKYFQAGTDGEWGRWQTEGETWPAPWKDDGGEPLGIPAFHLKYKSLGHPYGRSRLKAAVPFQDELNKQVVDLNMVMDHLGWPQRYVFGTDLDQSDVDALIGDYLVGGRSGELQVGQFAAADPKGILDSIEKILARLARRTRSPLHLITTGALPSGESIKAANSGIDHTASVTKTEWGNNWENGVRMLLKLGQTFGDAPDVDLSTLTIRCEWKDTGDENEKEQWETAVIKEQLGVSKDTLLTERGYDPEEEREKRAAELAESQERREMFFNRGNAPGAASEEPEEPNPVENAA